MKLAPYLNVKGEGAVMAPQRRLEGALNVLTRLNNMQTGSQTTSVGAMPTRGVVNSPEVLPKPGHRAMQFIASNDTVLRLD